MLDFLIHIDTQLFIFFNVHLANPVFDVVMPFVTGKSNWYPVWLGLTIFLIWKYRIKGLVYVLLIILAVGLADIIAYRFIKPWVGRIRPCNVVDGVYMLVSKRNTWSFPSNHAANFFALATMLTYLFRQYKFVFYTIAILVAYSRIAVGVHYPFDVIAGALLGYIIAKIVIYSYENYIKKRYKILNE